MRGFVLCTSFVLALAASAGAQENLPSPTPSRTVALLPIAARGVDPIVPRRVGETIAAGIASAGYTLADANAVARAMAMVRPNDPPTAADLWRITALSGADRGVAVVLGTESGQYAATFVIASADGTGPFTVHVTGSPADFLDRCAAAFASLLPPPSAFDAEAARRYVADANARAMATPAAPTWNPAPTPGLQPGGYRPFGYGRPRYPTTPRFGVSFISESAFGRNQGQRFYNHLLGARIDVRLGQEVYLGAFGGYVNVATGTGRGSNLLGYLQIEDRIRFLASGKLMVPIRFGVGYLPLNGPFMRFAAGLRFPVGESLELGLDLLAPTFWWIPQDRRVTYDVGAEITYRFGSRN